MAGTHKAASRQWIGSRWLARNAAAGLSGSGLIDSSILQDALSSAWTQRFTSATRDVSRASAGSDAGWPSWTGRRRRATERTREIVA